MNLSLGTTGPPSIAPIVTASEASTPQSLSEALTPSGPMVLADQVAKRLLMPSATTLAQVTSIYVSRRLVPPARYAGPDREEKTRGEFLRRVKVAKSEACGQQTQSRS